jgi:hypothetical protein
MPPGQQTKLKSFDEDDDVNNGRECFSSTHVKLNEEKKLKKRVDQLEIFFGLLLSFEI